MSELKLEQIDNTTNRKSNGTLWRWSLAVPCNFQRRCWTKRSQRSSCLAAKWSHSPFQRWLRRKRKKFVITVITQFSSFCFLRFLFNFLISHFLLSVHCRFVIGLGVALVAHTYISLFQTVCRDGCIRTKYGQVITYHS